MVVVVVVEGGGVVVAVEGGGGGVVTCSLLPLKKKSEFSVVPQNKNLDFLCYQFPQMAFVSLFPSVVDFCSPNPWEGLIYSLYKQLRWASYSTCR